MPWKNGGGSTTEIAVAPEAAAMTDFDWRISMARVESAGPFSVFPEIDRTLCVVAGQGLVLDGLGPEPVVLTQVSAPFAFAADRLIGCRLIGGAVTDLNVMTHRHRFRHHVDRFASCSIDAPVAFLVAVSTTDVAIDGAAVSLSPGDALRVDGGGQASLAEGTGQAYLIRLRPLA